MRKKYSVTATAFDSKRRPLSTCKNLYDKSHPLQKHFALLAGESSEKIYQHAEFRACIQAGTSRVNSLLIQRFNNDSSMANARPCKTCRVMLKAFGVEYVEYTTPTGIIKEYTKDFETQT
jgi:deoxycytidylate deaminase